jgi:hypothetical protein
VVATCSNDLQEKEMGGTQGGSVVPPNIGLTNGREGPIDVTVVQWAKPMVWVLGVGWASLPSNDMQELAACIDVMRGALYFVALSSKCR